MRQNQFLMRRFTTFFTTEFTSFFLFTQKQVTAGLVDRPGTGFLTFWCVRVGEILR